MDLHGRRSEPPSSTIASLVSALGAPTMVFEVSRADSVDLGRELREAAAAAMRAVGHASEAAAEEAGSDTPTVLVASQSLANSADSADSTDEDARTVEAVRGLVDLPSVSIESFLDRLRGIASIGGARIVVRRSARHLSSSSSHRAKIAG